MEKNERFLIRNEKWGFLAQDRLYDRIWALKNLKLSDNMYTSLPYRYEGEFIDKSILYNDLDLESPISISWEITSNCNSKCIFCCNDSGKICDELPLKKIENIAKLLKEWGCMRINIGGGEPLTRCDIIPILKLFEDSELKPAIATNGILLDNEELLKQISKSCITLQISLDTLEKEKYSKFRGIDAVEKVMGNIILAKRYVENIRVVTVLNKENECELESIAKFLNDFGIKQWFIFKLLPAGRGKDVIQSLGILDDSKIKKRLQAINNKYLNLSAWYWGTEKSDGVAIYITPLGNLEIVDYMNNTKFDFFDDEWDMSKIKEAWKSIDIDTKRATILNFTSKNKVLK